MSTEQIRAIKALLEGGTLHLSSFRQMEKALERLRQNHLAIAGLHHNSNLARMQTVVHEANSRLLASLGQIEIGSQTFQSMARVHATWMRDIQASVDRVSQVRAAASTALSESIELVTVAELFAARIDLGKLHLAAGRQADVIARVQASMDSLALRFDRLTKVAEELPNLTTLPSFVMPSASRELVTAGHSLVALSPGHDEVEAEEKLAHIREETSGAYELLRQEHPPLAKAYQGAREALVGGSVDRERHVLSSLRELWNHLLRTLAPDEEVLPWLMGRAEELIHEGKPTRRARVLYVCREINHGPLSDFLDSDTKALLDYMQLLNRLHGLERGLSDRQLSAVLLRTDSWLTFMMRISRDGYRC